MEPNQRYTAKHGTSAPQTAPKERRPLFRSNKARQNTLRAVKLICLFLALAVTAGVLQEFVLCHADHNRQRIKGFYDEDENSLDVVYLGASEVYSDIAPGYAYERSGVTGYLFATQANSILNYKAQLKNILSRQNPDLIVIELNGALYDNDGETTKEANLRNYADNVPLDSAKLEWMGSGGPDFQREQRIRIVVGSY